MKTSLIVAGVFAAGAVAECDYKKAAGLLDGPGSCKCFPGDLCWPLVSDWNSLNETVGGRLIATVPLGRACHDPNYDEARCQVLQDNWQNPAIQ